MNRSSSVRRFAPAALLAASALLLAGCAGSSPEPEATDATGTSGDACVALESGAASDAVKTDGTFGEAVTATFDAPLADIDGPERTIVDEGDGRETVDGDQVTVSWTLYNATTGEQILTQPNELTVGDATLPEALAGGFSCVPVGSRVVTLSPAGELFGTEGNPDYKVGADDAVVVITDVVSVAEPVERTGDAPAVTFEGDVPTMTLPDADAPTEFVLDVLEEGTGTAVAEGDSVTLNYLGVSWDSGLVFDSSFKSGQPATFATDQVITGFGKALVGQKVGSKLIATMPPAEAYGDEASGHALGGQTLVFYIEILETAPAAG
ncbi:FKBP-type peptidyl-prolyl cis-trans isomerase [Agromyces atrinae]|uniref:peptidylprolyl isomerase n=1 Tax=Agromyces atrinae TaxID=592376 RepID=A0A4Q2M373_9MICO|nr:FKBP-type peptidyl-prolyl cis-trans isomerase [Agromyces atrinae]MCI2956287.1 FKBP-type peptidyl-prolyl cis-trans isomerase [Agromyces atrinae]NYD68320.1 peptidylprolyl isomerase [Agromyces atrinae]RXZ85627.1 peptidylprolyl isomerase [Agromyces atrinae]